MAQENIPVYAQGTAGKQRLHCSARNWFGLTERIEQRSKVLAQVNGNRLVIRSSGPGQAMFLVDERRLLQVLSNLLTNAASYCRSGVIELTCRIEQVKASDDWSLSFAVSDTGPEIAPEDQQRIFHPFERGIEAHLSHHKGNRLPVQLQHRLRCSTARGDGMG